MMCIELICREINQRSQTSRLETAEAERIYKWWKHVMREFNIYYMRRDETTSTIHFLSSINTLWCRDI